MTNTDVAHALDQTLTDLINLGLVSKHAHWNLVGPGFRNLHLLLDDLADVARDGGDSVAERSMTLGRNPDGRATTVAANNPLPPLDLGPLRDVEAISTFLEVLDIITTRLFESISDSGCDLVTQSLMIGVAAQLDKLAWMIRAHGAKHDRTTGAGTGPHRRAAAEAELPGTA